MFLFLDHQGEPLVGDELRKAVLKIERLTGLEIGDKVKHGRFFKKNPEDFEIIDDGVIRGARMTIGSADSDSSGDMEDFLFHLSVGEQSHALTSSQSQKIRVALWVGSSIVSALMAVEFPKISLMLAVIFGFDSRSFL